MLVLLLFFSPERFVYQSSLPRQKHTDDWLSK